jgi:hypothetical protein
VDSVQRAADAKAARSAMAASSLESSYTIEAFSYEKARPEKKKARGIAREKRPKAP